MKQFFYKRFVLGILCVLGLSSCTYTQVCTHTLTDAVGKECYRGMEVYPELQIYRRNGVYYARHVFYKAPAESELYNYYILGKDSYVTHVGRSKVPEYKQGMKLGYVYYALDAEDLRTLLPGRKYKAPSEGERRLPQSAFDGMKPIATITDAKKIRAVWTAPASELLSCERSAVNYMLMPVTGTLYVADAALSVAITAAVWVGFNIPFVVGGMIYCACEEALE